MRNVQLIDQYKTLEDISLNLIVWVLITIVQLTLISLNQFILCIHEV